MSTSISLIYYFPSGSTTDDSLPATPSVRSLSRPEEYIPGVPPVAGSSVDESVCEYNTIISQFEVFSSLIDHSCPARPPRLRLPGPEEPSYSVPSATTVTISVPREYQYLSNPTFSL